MEAVGALFGMIVIGGTLILFLVILLANSRLGEIRSLTKKQLVATDKFQQSMLSAQQEQTQLLAGIVRKLHVQADPALSAKEDR